MKTNENQYDAIVIGSGIGGLAAAALLAKTQHKRVLVLEKHWVAGGLTHTFKRAGGYEWDVGLHYVGGLRKQELPRKLLDFISEGRLHWQALPYLFERFVYPECQFSVPSDPRQYQADLMARFPSEKLAIKNYFKHVNAANNWAIRHFLQAAAPAWLRYPLQALNLYTRKLALQTTQTYLDAHFRDPQLKALLASQWGDYGLLPEQSAFAIHAMIAAHYWYGAGYPEGGSGQLAASILPTITAAGGECLTNCEVTDIIVNNQQAIGVKAHQLRSGQSSEYYAPLIISNIGAYETYTRFLSAYAPREQLQELEQLRQDSSAVTLYIGFKESPQVLGFKGENHWLNTDTTHADHSTDLLNGQARFCYLSFPSLKNPSAKQHTAEIIAFVSHATFQRWQTQTCQQRDAEYQALKQRISTALLNLVEQHYPGFQALVAYTELSTPLSIEHFTSRDQGRLYGIPATPARYRSKLLRPQTPLAGLYLSGSDVCSPGIVGAMMGGLACVTAASPVFSLPCLLKQVWRFDGRRGDKADTQAVIN